MKRLAIAVCVAMGGASGASQAELVRDGVWEVEEGQKLDTVLSAAFPNEPLRQRRIERLAKRLSPDAFDESGELVAGQELRLPGARMPKQKTAEISREGEVGRVVVVSGSGSAKGDDGRARPLERGAPVYKGDTLSTERSRAQVRFSDGSLVSLRPNTQFKVEEYQYDGEEGEEERGLFNLIKGGFRTISGAIGKLNRDNYEVKTAVATIGIRGTHYGVTICDPCQDGDEERRGLFGGVVDGEIVVKNDQGEFTFGNDEYFHLPDGGGKPRGVIVPPGFVFGNDEDEAPDGEGDGGDSDGTAGGGGQGGYSDPDADQRSAESNQNGPDNDFESDKDDSDFNSRRGDDLVAELEDLQDQGLLPDSLDFRSEEDPVTGSDPFPLPAGEPLQVGQATVVGMGGTKGFDGSTDIFAGGFGAGDGFYLTPQAGGGFVLSDIDFVDSDGSRFVFRSQDSGATLAENGYEAGFDISWGRWSDVELDVEKSAEGVVVSDTFEVSTGLHYMVPGDAVTNATDFENKMDQLASFELLNTDSYGGAIFQPLQNGSGSIAATTPVDMAGQTGELGFAELRINMTDYSVSELNINAGGFADGSSYNLYYYDSTGEVTVADIVNDPSLSIAMDGSCFGGVCTGGTNDGGWNVEGEANIRFVIAPVSDGMPDGGVGAAVQYSGIGVDGNGVENGDIGVVGTVFLSGNAIPQ
ncbi:MAG: FecR family protein [Pseudomonadota bacterium]